MAAVAVAMALLAGALVFPARERIRPAARTLTPDAAGRVPLLLAGSAAALAGGLVVTYAEGTDLALGLIAVAVALAVARLLAASRRRRSIARTEDRVLELCEMLSGELRAGQPPVRALESSVTVWPDFEPVAAAGRLGADVPAALKRVGERPGAHGLLPVAAAWQVSEASGAGLASALTQVAQTVRDARATKRLIASELASAQATARMVAILPLGVLAMGSGIGGDPWGFLLHSPAGLTCLALGLTLAYAGLVWIDRIALGVGRT